MKTNSLKNTSGDLLYTVIIKQSTYQIAPGKAVYCHTNATNATIPKAERRNIM